MNTLTAVIAAVIGFGVLIIVHEFGHFTLAKLNGVKVEEFSIGMGPKIFSKKGKETVYSLSMLPIGGYVKMMGEEENIDDERSFSAKSPLRRISIIIAGVTMNYILAILIFTTISFKFGFAKPVIGTVQSNSAAAEAGLKAGDKIVKIDNNRVFTSDDIRMGIVLCENETLNIVVDRDGQKKEFNIVPMEDSTKGKVLGIQFAVENNPGIFQSFKEGINQTATYVSQTFKGLKMIFTGKANLKTDVGGPVTIVKMTTATAKAGIWNLINFVGFISVNLAVFNLLPFPALDGGWCVILLIELITRRKVPEKIVSGLNFVGFAALMGLMVVVTVKDILFPIKF